MRLCGWRKDAPLEPDDDIDRLGVELRTRGVCVFKSDSVDTVRTLVEGAAGKVSSNEYYATNEGTAQGLPV